MADARGSPGRGGKTMAKGLPLTFALRFLSSLGKSVTLLGKPHF